MAHSVETRFVGIDSILAASVLNQRPQSSVLQYLPLRPSHAAFDTKFDTSLALGRHDSQACAHLVEAPTACFRVRLDVDDRALVVGELLILAVGPYTDPSYSKLS